MVCVCASFGNFIAFLLFLFSLKCECLIIAVVNVSLLICLFVCLFVCLIFVVVFLNN